MDEIKQQCKARKEGPHRHNLKLSRRVWKVCMWRVSKFIIICIAFGLHVDH